MKKLILMLALLIVAASAFAEYKDLPREVQANLGAIQKYPKAASIILWQIDGYALGNDGRQQYVHRVFRYLPDEAARDAWGDPHVPFVYGRDELEIKTARTYTADGRIIDCTPQNAFNPIVPEDGLDKAPDFTVFQQMVITLLGLENGCITELDYRITNKQPLYPWLEGRVYCRAEVPVMLHQITVAAPVGTTITYRADHGMPEPTTVGNSFTWLVNGQPGYDKHDLQGHRILLPNVSFTTARDWAEIRAALADRITASSSEPLTLPASLAARLAGTPGDETRLDTIKTWVRERFNRLEFHEHPDFALTLRPAAHILESGYGNDFEMAVLVKSLARAAGFTTLHVVPAFVPEPVVPSLVEWAAPVLRSDKLNLICDALDPREDVSLRDMQGSWLLDPLSKKSADGPELVKDGALSYELELAVDDLGADTLRGMGTLTVLGPCGVYEAVRAAGAEEFLGGEVKLGGFAVTESRVLDLRQDERASRVELSFRFTAAALDTVDGCHVLPLALADFAKLTPSAPLDLLTREFRQDVGAPGSIQVHFSAPLPENWQVTRKPAALDATVEFDRMSASCEVKNGRLLYDRVLWLDKEWVSAESWPKYRAFLLDAGSEHRNSVVFGPQAAKASK